MKRLAWISVLAPVLLLRAPLAWAHGPQMMLGSTAPGSGALALSYDFTGKVVVTESLTLGGMTLYTSLFPGFEWLQTDDPTDSLYALAVGTQFSMQIVSIDSGASVMLGSKTLTGVGQSAFVATTTNVAGDHFHPQWQLILPTGVFGDYTVSFKVTTTAHAYAASQVYTLTITNADATPTPIATALPSLTPTDTSSPTASATAEVSATETALPSATPTPTVTPTPAPLLGDANCDGRVNAADLPAEIGLLGPGASIPCGADLNRDGAVDEQDLFLAIDALFTR